MMVSEACSSSRRPRLASRILSDRPSPVRASFSRICFKRFAHISAARAQTATRRALWRLLAHDAQGKCASYVSVKGSCCEARLMERAASFTHVIPVRGQRQGSARARGAARPPGAACAPRAGLPAVLVARAPNFPANTQPEAELKRPGAVCACTGSHADALVLLV